MEKSEAKKLKVGARVVIWNGTPAACTGTVVEEGFNARKFVWDDGQIGVIHLDDMSNVDRLHHPCVVRPETNTAAALIGEAIEAWPQLDKNSDRYDHEINGGDAVEWLGGWIERARAVRS